MKADLILDTSTRDSKQGCTNLSKAFNGQKLKTEHCDGSTFPSEIPQQFRFRKCTLELKMHIS